MKKCLIAVITTLTASLGQSQGIITTVAGTGTCCADADGVSATLAYLQGPDGLTIDSAGNLYIWENQPFRVRKIVPSRASGGPAISEWTVRTGCSYGRITVATGD